MLAVGGVKFIALRCAGYDKVDLHTAARLGIRVARVPSYSPHSVAEHAVALLLCLNRHAPVIQSSTFARDQAKLGRALTMPLEALPQMFVDSQYPRAEGFQLSCSSFRYIIIGNCSLTEKTLSVRVALLIRYALPSLSCQRF